MNISDRIDKPTREDLIALSNKLSNLDKYIIYIITKINYNLFIFISGIATAMSVNLFTNLVEFKMNCVLYFFAYILLTMFAILLTISIIKFTIRYIEVRDKTSRIIIEEAYINQTFENCISNLKYFKNKFKTSIFYAICVFINILACFLILNLYC